jgi:hypothetical protein
MRVLGLHTLYSAPRPGAHKHTRTRARKHPHALAHAHTRTVTCTGAPRWLEGNRMCTPARRSAPCLCSTAGASRSLRVVGLRCHGGTCGCRASEARAGPNYDTGCDSVLHAVGTRSCVQQRTPRALSAVAAALRVTGKARARHGAACESSRLCRSPPQSTAAR